MDLGDKKDEGRERVRSQLQQGRKGNGLEEKYWQKRSETSGKRVGRVTRGQGATDK